MEEAQTTIRQELIAEVLPHRLLNIGREVARIDANLQRQLQGYVDRVNDFQIVACHGIGAYMAHQVVP